MKITIFVIEQLPQHDICVKYRLPINHQIYNKSILSSFYNTISFSWLNNARGFGKKEMWIFLISSWRENPFGLLCWSGKTVIGSVNVFSDLFVIITLLEDFWWSSASLMEFQFNFNTETSDEISVKHRYLLV